MSASRTNVFYVKWTRPSMPRGSREMRICLKFEKGTEKDLKFLGLKMWQFVVKCDRFPFLFYFLFVFANSCIY